METAAGSRNGQNTGLFASTAEMARGDRTGWLPREDSNLQMSNSNPVSDGKTWKSGLKSGNDSPLVGFKWGDRTCRGAGMDPVGAG